MNQLQKRHINSYIHSIISLAKKQGVLTFKEIELHLKIDIISNPQLYQALEKNSKIKIKNGYIEYVPSFIFASVNELISLLKSGVTLDELTDLNQEKIKIVKEAEDRGLVYILKDNEDIEVVFPNEFGVKNISEDVRNLYKSIKVPTYQDVLKELTSFGIKKVEDKKYKHILIRKKKSKRYKRNIKITNTHVKDLDWNDYKQND